MLQERYDVIKKLLDGFDPEGCDNLDKRLPYEVTGIHSPGLDPNDSFEDHITPTQRAQDDVGLLTN